MLSVNIDQERLAYSLQRGIGRVEDAVLPYYEIPKRYRLRVPVCGLVSVGIAEHLNARGVDTSLKLSSPKLQFDEGLKHVMPVIEDEEDPLIIDASYSQFLDFVGLDPDYEIFTKEKHFPKEKIISFRFSERELITGWLVGVAASFQDVNTMPEMDGIKLGRGALATADSRTLKKTFDRIWHPNNFTTWSPTPATQREGQRIASYIDSRAIEII